MKTLRTSQPYVWKIPSDSTPIIGVEYWIVVEDLFTKPIKAIYSKNGIWRTKEGVEWVHVIKYAEIRTLTLNLKWQYFEAIKEGKKLFEYREVKPYWEKRLIGKEFDKIVICSGYPPKDDPYRRIERPWKGYEIKTIKHVVFDFVPTKVFAIWVNLPEKQKADIITCHMPNWA